MKAKVERTASQNSVRIQVGKDSVRGYMVNREWNFAAKVIWEGFEANFSIAEVVGWQADSGNEFHVPLFKRSGSNDPLDTVEDFEDAERFAAGFVKPNGCSDWEFSSGYHHFCDEFQLQGVSAMMLAVFQFCMRIHEDAGNAKV